MHSRYRLRFYVFPLCVLFGAVPLRAQEKKSAPPKAKTQQAEFYRSDKVQTIHLTIAENELKRLQQALPKRIYVPATFRWRETTVENVAVRYKGNSSSNPRQPFKRSFLIKFNEYKKKQRFVGLRRASLDNGIQFGSLFSEPIVTDILLDLGIKTHRANYARLFLNGKFHGVYVNVERIDETFVRQHLGNGRGALYKVDLGGPGGNLQYLGDDPSVYAKTFEQKSKAAGKHTSDLVELLKLINRSPADGFAKRLEERLELNDFIRTSAVMLLAGAFDQLTGWNAHNYYLYRDPSRNRWRYLPWDLDVGFAEIAFGRLRILDEWHAAWPVAGRRPNPLMERIEADPNLLKRYRVAAAEILERYFQPARLEKILDAKYALIKDDLANDPFPARRVTNPSDRSYDDIISSMKVFIRKRYQSAKAQLKEPGERPKLVRRQGGGPGGRPIQPRPGKVSTSDPTKLQALASDRKGVTLSWKDNAMDEAGHIIQRAVVEAGKKPMFGNYMGRPGRSEQQAIDSRVEPGKTYSYRVYAVFPTPQGPKGSGVSNVVTVRIPK